MSQFNLVNEKVDRLTSMLDIVTIDYSLECSEILLDASTRSTRCVAITRGTHRRKNIYRRVRRGRTSRGSILWFPFPSRRRGR